MFEMFYVFACVEKMKFISEPQLLWLVFHIPKNLEQWLLSLCWTSVINEFCFSRISSKVTISVSVQRNVQFNEGIKKREQILS